MLALAFFLQDSMDTETAKHLVMLFALLIPIIILVVIAIIMVPCWFICKKAGFSPWLSLLCIFPSLGTLILLYILAFSDWKVAPVAQLTPYQPPYPPPYPPAPPTPPTA